MIKYEKCRATDPHIISFPPQIRVFLFLFRNLFNFLLARFPAFFSCSGGGAELPSSAQAYRSTVGLNLEDDLNFCRQMLDELNL